MKTKLLTLLVLFACYSCQDDKLGDRNSTVEAQKVNQFLETHMKDIYYWADQIKDKNPDKNKDPQLYFNTLKHREDQWSHLSNENSEGKILALEDGYDYGFGYNVTFWLINNNTDQQIVKINFVFPNTPAAEAGLTKGDLITRINGSNINNTNRQEILNGETITIQVKKTSGETKTHTLTSRRFDMDPILHSSVLTAPNGKKVGYLFYAKFTAQKGTPNSQWNEDPYLKKMTETIQNLKSKGIEELILDLRFNGGGYSTAAVQLASLIAPLSIVRAGKTLIKEQWNSKYASNESFITFYQDIPENANLNLSRLYVLTNSGTASASEVVISGLKPYMEKIITIGQTTVGKNMGGQTFSPGEDEISNWYAYLITFTYTNSQNESIANGIQPTISINPNDDFDDCTPLGSPQDAHIAVALQQIARQSGMPISSKTSQARNLTPELPITPMRLILNEPDHLSVYR